MKSEERRGQRTPVDRACITRPRAKSEVLIFLASERRASDSNDSVRSSACYFVKEEISEGTEERKKEGEGWRKRRRVKSLT